MEFTFKDVVASYAAIVSTIALGWNIFNEVIRKRTRLKVVVRRATVEMQPSGISEEQVAIHVVNIGHTSCVLMQAGFDTKDGFFQIFPGEGTTTPEWGEKLEPAHTQTVFISKDLLERKGVQPPFRGAYVTDSTGKKYSAKRGMGNK